MQGSSRPSTPQILPDNPFDLVGEKWMLISGGQQEGFQHHDGLLGRHGRALGQEGLLLRRTTRAATPIASSKPAGSLPFRSSMSPFAMPSHFAAAIPGRDVDKVRQTGLTPVFAKRGCQLRSRPASSSRARRSITKDIDPAHFLDPPSTRPSIPSRITTACTWAR